MAKLVDIMCGRLKSGPSLSEECWGWIVVAVVFCNLLLANGMFYVSGIFVDTLVKVQSGT